MSNSIPAGGPFKAAVGLHEPLTASTLAQTRRILASYCASSWRDLCLKIIKVSSEASALVSRARFEDLAFNGTYRGSDSPLFEKIRVIINFYAKLIAGLIVVYGDKPLVRAKAKVPLGNSTLEPGEVVLLPLAEAALLSALGFVEPVESNLLKFAQPGVGEGSGGEEDGEER